jgi:hypothetical protein
MRNPMRGLVVALSLVLALPGQAAETPPLDFDPALLLEDAPVATPAAEPARPVATPPAPAAAPRPVAPARSATPATPVAPKPVARPVVPVPATATPAPEAPRPRLAPLQGELLDYVSQSTVVWQLRTGETLRDALNRWSRDAGWTLIWKASRDYRIDAPLALPTGTSYREAVKTVVRAVWRSNPTLHATAYTNQVLVIQDSKEAVR